MAKEEWGVKRLCPTTGKRFYDMNRDPVVSPYTGEVVEIETGKRSMIAADAEDGATRKSKSKEKKRPRTPTTMMSTSISAMTMFLTTRMTITSRSTRSQTSPTTTRTEPRKRAAAGRFWS